MSEKTLFLVIPSSGEIKIFGQLLLCILDKIEFIF